MINKEMWFFWGNKTMSWMRYMTLYSFRKLNPDWKMILYKCKPNSITTKTWGGTPSQDYHNFEGLDYMDRISNLDIEIRDWELHDLDGKSCPEMMGPSHKSNFFKWQKLSEDNGFYSDMDILYVNPIRSYYEGHKNKSMIICHQVGYFSIGFLGSSGDNRFFADIYKNAFDNFNIGRYQCVGVRNIYNWLGKLSGEDREISSAKGWDVFTKFYPEIRCHNNKMVLVYPWSCSKMHHVFDRECYTKGHCIGIHWYAGSKIAQKYNSILTDKNYKNYKNTFCHYANWVLEK